MGYVHGPPETGPGPHSSQEIQNIVFWDPEGRGGGRVLGSCFRSSLCWPGPTCFIPLSSPPCVQHDSPPCLGWPWKGERKRGKELIQNQFLPSGQCGGVRCLRIGALHGFRGLLWTVEAVVRSKGNGKGTQGNGERGGGLCWATMRGEGG